MYGAHKNKGFGLVEVLIAASIMSLVIVAIISTATFFLRTSSKNVPNLQASYLLEEGVEALKFLRDNGWGANINTLNEGQNYYFYWTGSQWSATTSTTTIDSMFYRTFVLTPVYRDSNDDIAASGNLDTETLKATVTVAWFDTATEATTSKSFVTYITNLFDN